MPVGSAIAIFFIIWWLTFFIVLPFGARRRPSAHERIAGTDAGAPARTLLLRKMLVTTVLAAVVFGGVYWVIVESGLTLDEIPLPSPPGVGGDPS
jgi:predicted secreted protein